jgi:dethiobiotin synthetase
MQQNFFITGTDTGVGKTLISCALLSKLSQQGLTVQGMKPVASGCQQTPDGLRNEDAELLMNYSSMDLPYSTINPYAYAEAVAPHLLADQVGETIKLELIRDKYREISSQSDCVIVEGVGGWMVPLNNTQTVADLAVLLDLPVVLVVGMRLGCINHALLTHQAIIDSGLSCAGWIANQIDADMQRVNENITAIEQRIGAPLLGKVNYDECCDIEIISRSLSLG